MDSLNRHRIDDAASADLRKWRNDQPQIQCVTYRYHAAFSMSYRKQLNTHTTYVIVVAASNIYLSDFSHKLRFSLSSTHVNWPHPITPAHPYMRWRITDPAQKAVELQWSSHTHTQQSSQQNKWFPSKEAKNCVKMLSHLGLLMSTPPIFNVIMMWEQDVDTENAHNMGVTHLCLQ